MATNAIILPSKIKYTDDKNIKHELFLKPRQTNITNNNELIDLYKVDEIIYIDNDSLKISTIGNLAKKYKLYIDDLDIIKELLKHDIYNATLGDIHHVIDISLSDKIINKILENSDHTNQLLNNIYKIHIPPSSTIIQRYYNNFIYDIRDTLIYLKINLKETPSIKNYLYKKIYNANQSNPILNELNEYYSEADTYKKISGTTIYEVKKYTDIEIIKILIDMDIDVSKHNITQFKTAFINMCEDIKNTNGRKYFSIYIVAKIDIAKIYTEQHSSIADM